MSRCCLRATPLIDFPFQKRDDLVVPYTKLLKRNGLNLRRSLDFDMESGTFIRGLVLLLCLLAQKTSSEECAEPLGLQSGEIKHNRITASSEKDSGEGKFAAKKARLNLKGSWMAGNGDFNPWLQVDLTSETKITRIATQGRGKAGNNSHWVTNYTLQYKVGSEFQNYSEEGKPTAKFFKGNSDSNTTVYHQLNPPIKARFIRLNIIAWQDKRAAMRMELYGCHEDQYCRELKFTTVIKGQALKNHVIQTIDVFEEDFCGAKCFMEKSCVSYNFKSGASAQNCDLNNSTDTEYPEDLVSDEHYKYSGSKDACKDKPCQNNATCLSGFSRVRYRCLCAEGFLGKDCEVDIDECASNPCLNGAACHNLINKYNCTCLPGFTGEDCSENIDECASSPCLNNGTCNDDINSYRCTCLPGFTGHNCSEDINECASNPCLNNGTCHDHINRYSCRCLPGFTGHNCSEDINKCVSNPCLHNGTCTNLVNDYRCDCYRNFTGKNCENVPNECSHYVNLTERNRRKSAGVGNNFDNALDGWYRFSGDAGTKMLDVNPGGLDRCTTTFPGYLLGGLPFPENGQSKKQVCFHGGGSIANFCCIWIKVRSCIEFVVYELKPIQDFNCQNIRYCSSD